MPQFLIRQQNQTVTQENQSNNDPVLDRLDQLLQHLAYLETQVSELVQQRPAKEWYATEEVAELLGKAHFTVREWCRLGRIRAEKRACGRGQSREWMIAHAELTRLRNEGLLPLRRPEY